jgi:catechol 2,3-dioxygenase-like lactoylglutathione lyase family enzyme
VFRLHHVNLGVPVGGQEDEEGFLMNVLGYRLVPPPPELEGVVRWFESEDGSQIHLSEDPDHRAAARAHVAVEFGDDLPALEQRLGIAGILSDAIDVDGVRLVFCSDPAGNRWELRGPALDSK